VRAEAFVRANGFTSNAATMPPERLFLDINEDLLPTDDFLAYRRDSLLPDAIGLRRGGTAPQQVDGWTVVFASNPAWLRKQPQIRGQQLTSVGGAGVFVPDKGDQIVKLHLKVDLGSMDVSLSQRDAVRQACSGGPQGLE